jgi:hypothetical protein
LNTVNWLIMLGGCVFTVFLLVFLPDWKARYGKYIIFLITSSLFYGWMSHILVVSGFLEFTWRFLPHYTLDNILYDIIIFPGFSLFMVVYGNKNAKRFVIYGFLFAVVIALQDYIAAEFTNMVVMKNWTAYHTAVGCIVLYVMWSLYYKLLGRFCK